MEPGRCGCFYYLQSSHRPQKRYLPQLKLDAHATILSASSRTVLTQTFVNPSSTDSIPEVSYEFPLYDGVSVVGFTCHVRDTVLRGRVESKQKAKEIYEKAKERGEAAALLSQSVSASDVFMTRLGNVPADGRVVVEITVLGELKQDAQADGVRYTLPNKITPRYGDREDDLTVPSKLDLGGISIMVDVVMEKGLVIRTIQSPSHPIRVELGRTSKMSEDIFERHCASAKLGIKGDDAVMKEDFILIVKTDMQDTPCALLETHPANPDQRALMVSLVPKFGLPLGTPEIVFVIDRSGSMSDKIPTLKSALRVFLKSLPLGVHFNIISFGSSHSSLWGHSQAYDQTTLKRALEFTDSIGSDMGGTEILTPLKAVVTRRLKDQDLEVLLLTDGEVWNQQHIFDFVTEAAGNSPTRFFSLGIGNGASHSLIEGIARAGKGFSQSVTNYEELDRKVIRMLKGALMPHIDDYTLDLHVPLAEEEDFELIEPVDGQSSTTVEMMSERATSTQTISLYDEEYKESDARSNGTTAEISQPLPKINIPAAIQTPTDIPPLYPFIRSTIYVLFSPKTGPLPDKITLRATSKHGPLSLEIPITNAGQGETIHQLAVKKAMIDLAEGRGWLRQVKDRNGTLIKEKWKSRLDELVKNECERLGDSFQVAGKYCSFVAVDGLTGDLQRTHDVYQALDRLEEKAGLEIRLHLSGIPPPIPSTRLRIPSAIERGERLDANSLSLDTLREKSASFRRSKKRGIASWFQLPKFASTDEKDKTHDVLENTDPITSKVYSLIAMQTFDGPWDWSDALFEVLDMDEGKTKYELRALYKKASGDDPVALESASRTTIFATCLVGLFFEKKAPDSKELWELVKSKADDWVKITMDSLDHKDQEIMRKVIDGMGSLL